MSVYQKLHQLLKQRKPAVMISRMTQTHSEKKLVAPDSQNSALSYNVNGVELTLTEYFRPRPRLVILGGGHIAVPLAQIAKTLDFEVAIADDRPLFANHQRFPSADTIICNYFDDAIQALALGADDYVAIVTRGHRHDQDCLRLILSGPEPGYVGMIGSRRRVAIVKKQLLEEGLDGSTLSHLHSPIGLPIGAITPAEIAVSILAEMISHKRKETPVKLKRDEYADLSLMEHLANNKHDQTAMATIIDTQGSVPREIGAKMLVFEDGSTLGSIGGGCAEADLTREAGLIIQNGGFCLKKVDLTDTAEEDGMVCGGQMTLLIEKIDTREL